MPALTRTVLAKFCTEDTSRVRPWISHLQVDNLVFLVGNQVARTGRSLDRRMLWCQAGCLAPLRLSQPDPPLAQLHKMLVLFAQDVEQLCFVRDNADRVVFISICDLQICNCSNGSCLQLLMDHKRYTILSERPLKVKDWSGNRETEQLFQLFSPK